MNWGVVKSFQKLTSTEEEAVKAYFMHYVKDECEHFILNKLILNKIKRVIDFFRRGTFLKENMFINLLQ